MKLIPVTAIAAVALAAAACSSQATAAAPAADRAPAPSASPTHAAAPTPTAAAKPTPAASTAACREIVRTVNADGTDAQSQTTAKLKQFPDLNKADLLGEFIAQDIKDSATAIGSEETAAGVTPGLASAERELVTSATELYSNYGIVADDTKYGDESQDAVNAITKVCG